MKYSWFVIGFLVGVAYGVERPVVSNGYSTYNVDVIEFNEYGEGAAHGQYIFWTLRNDSGVKLIDRGYMFEVKCKCTQRADKSWMVTIPDRMLHIVAPRYQYSRTDRDAEFMRRDGWDYIKALR